MDVKNGTLSRLVLDNLPQAVIVADSAGRIVYANMQAEVFFSCSAALLMRYRLDSFLLPANPLVALIGQVIKKRVAINEYRMDFSSPHFGERHIVDVQIACADDMLDQAIVLFRERNVVEKLGRRLEHRGAVRSVSGLASMLVHEIKNPLSGIRGAAQLLEISAQESRNAADCELAGLIQKETDRIVALVDRMNMFSDEKPLERSPVNLHNVLGHVKKLAQNGFASHIRISEDYDPSLPPVWGNEGQLIQVFLNLVKNAAESIGNGKNDERLICKNGLENRQGEIELTSAYRAGMHMVMPESGERLSLPLEFCVCDNGRGVAPDILPYVFEPFLTTKPNGSGLGLPLSAKIIADHGGVIECESLPGNTAFKVLLPVFRETG